MTPRRASQPRSRQARNATPARARPRTGGPGTSRPLARRPRGKLLANRLILAVLVVLALGGLYGLAGLSRPMALAARQTAASLGALPVTSALVACPGPGTAGLIGGNIAEASAPAGTGSGQVTLTELRPGGKTPGPVRVSTSPQPGQLTIKSIPNAPALTKKLATLAIMARGQVPTSVGRGGLIVSATGANAQGLDVEQLNAAGQPTARCQPPGSDFWFVGPGSTTTNTELYLMNTDSVPADADLSVLTETGPQLGAVDSGITVPPHGMVVQDLSNLLHGAKAIALHVTTSTGRVVAAVRETTSLKKPGIWLPAASEPATTQMLSGLPGTAGTRMLYITVPGNVAARAKVTAVTPRGSYQPTGGSAISLLPRQTEAVPIPSLSGSPGSIEISANVPVTAELEITGGPPGAPGAMIGGSGPVTGQGVVAASPAGAAGTTELVLSAPGRAASVRITQAIVGAALTGQTGRVVQIKAKSSVAVKITLPKHSKASVFALVITPQPGSGPVYAARLADVGHVVQTVLPVVSSPTRIELPYVRSSLVSALGDQSSSG